MENTPSGSGEGAASTVTLGGTKQKPDQELSGGYGSGEGGKKKRKVRIEISLRGKKNKPQVGREKVRLPRSPPGKEFKEAGQGGGTLRPTELERYEPVTENL